MAGIGKYTQKITQRLRYQKVYLFLQVKATKKIQSLCFDDQVEINTESLMKTEKIVIDQLLWKLKKTFNHSKKTQ